MNNVMEWTKDDIHFVIKQHTSLGHYCGYCTFPLRPVKEQGYRGILTYVPVHGGITLANNEEEEMTYGFDCMHCDDDANPLMKDINWLKAECERMALAIQVAAKYEDAYLEAKDSKEKASVLDEYHKELSAHSDIKFDLRDNFGAMLSVLGGEL